MRIMIILALTCSVALATGGEQDTKQDTGPTVAPQVTDATTPPINVIIEEEPTDHWGLAIKYGLPVLGTVILGLAALWWGKKKKGGKDGDGKKGAAE